METMPTSNIASQGSDARVERPPLLLSITEFHAELDGRVGLNSLYRLIRLGRIKSIRLGERKILIPASEVGDWPMRELERQA